MTLWQFKLGITILGLTAQVTSLGSRDNSTKVSWVPCGAGLSDAFQCANVPVPLDYNNTSDTRTISLAVTRFLASDQVNRCLRPL